MRRIDIEEISFLTYQSKKLDKAISVLYKVFRKVYFTYKDDTLDDIEELKNAYVDLDDFYRMSSQVFIKFESRQLSSLLLNLYCIINCSGSKGLRNEFEKINEAILGLIKLNLRIKNQIEEIKEKAKESKAS